MRKIIIFDFETFKYDCLLGTKIIEGDSPYYFQTWDLEEIKKFYKENINSIWVGWNNQRYDNFILQTIVRGGNPKKTNDMIIEENQRIKLEIQLYNYDLISNHFTSLKTTEAFVGKNISETEVDFNLDRHLTEEEKLLTESYNRDDLDQSFSNFLNLQDEFIMRLELINEFNLSLNDLSITGTQIAEKVLGASRIYGIESKKIAPKIYDSLKLNNIDLLNYYLREKFRTDEKLTIEVCGVKHQIGSGGAHGAEKNVKRDWALYLDVSGYYNLVMLNYDLLPRTLSDEGKRLYRYMYEQQLLLKGVNDVKRGVYKTVLLSVFGAMMNKYTNFYDPQKGLLVTITGQLFIIDLLEKLEGMIELLQTNTDGIIVIPINGYTEKQVLDVVQEWMDRTGFVIKPKKIYNIVQRDVNNYIYLDEDNRPHCKGEAVKHYNGSKNPFSTDGYNSKEALIIHSVIVNYFCYNKLPEQTIEENKDNLQLFQYICKKGTYDYVNFEEFVKEVNKKGKEEFVKVNSIKIQNVNRVFASKNKDRFGRIVKYKLDGKNAKVSNLPDSVFVFNSDLSKMEKNLMNNIDYDYYVYRSYVRILEFLGEKVNE